MRTTSRAHALHLLIALCALTACGGGADPVTPPSEQQQNQQPGPPASIAIVSGDAQSAQRNGVLPVKLSVLVKDAKGTALSGVSVVFRVDSGGGTLSTTTANTDANGVAVGGNWTLGNAIGTQVATASVASLSPIKFHAQAMAPDVQKLIDKVTVPNTGGTFKYVKAGDPLNGFTITVPNKSYAVSTEWTVTADSTSHATLPADFTQYGPVITVTNASGYSDSLISVTMPLTLGDDIAIAPFYYDSATNYFEGIPLVERTTTSVTFATRHFSRDLIAMPANANATSALRQSMALGFGEVKIVWVLTPKQKLVGTFNSGFHVGTDNWEYANVGDYVSPGGICEGMSISEMYYFYFRKSAGAPALYHHFDLTIPNVLDNVQGRRFAASIQGDADDRFAAGIDQRRTLVAQGLAHGTAVENLTSSWILLTLKLTSRPVLLGLYRTGGAHAVVATAATSTGSRTDVTFADPNAPTTARVMTFNNGVIASTSFAQNAGATPRIYNEVYTVSVTTDVPLAQISSRYTEFTQQKAGANRYPQKYRAEYYDNITEKWLEIPSAVTTTDAHFTYRHICEDCPSKNDGAAANQQFMTLWNAAGSAQIEDANVGAIDNREGTAQYYVYLSAYAASSPTEIGFLDAFPISVSYQRFVITRPDEKYVIGSEVTFTAEAGSLDTPGSMYTWEFDDGASGGIGGKQFKHKFLKPGVYTAQVTLRNVNGKVIARATNSITIGVKAVLSPSPLRVSPGNPIKITAIVDGVIPPEIAKDVKYRWTLSQNGHYAMYDTNDPSIDFTLDNEGTYFVALDIEYKNQFKFAQIGDTPLQVKQAPGAWRLTKLTLVSSTPTDNGFLPAWVAGYNTMKATLDRAQNAPGDAMIFLEDNDLWKEHAVYFQIAPVGQGLTATYWVPGSFYTLLARESSVQFSHYTSAGTLKTGNIDGAGYVETLGVPTLNTIVAQKNGAQMTGTIKISPYTHGGERVYSFMAVLVTP